MRENKVRISVVIPVYNEENNVGILHRELLAVLDKVKTSFEIIFVDDGSIDGTFAVLKKLPLVKIVRLRRNSGQTAALLAGLNESLGEIIVIMDGDLQSDPRDIPKLLGKLSEGYDLVNGWRFKRQDPLSKKIPSKIANWIISGISGVRLHDYGCSLKAFKRNLISSLELYGEMHRLIPVLAIWQGARVTEIKVTHRRRRYGSSKYGLSRIPRVVLDLVTVKFFLSYLNRPMRVFGAVGLFLGSVGFLISLVLTWQRVINGVPLFNRPLLLLGVLLILVGLQFVGVGLLAEIAIRIYFKTAQKSSYLIKEIVYNGKNQSN